MHARPTRCPTCASPLAVRQLACPQCPTTVSGQWAPAPFDALSAEQSAFLLLFVRARGNLSDVERALAVSYPTVRAKLDEVIAVLAEPADDRRAMLERVARGALSPAEALAALRGVPVKEETP